MKYIVNGSLILKDKIVENTDIGFDSKICEIIDEKQIPKGSDIIDAKGAL